MGDIERCRTAHLGGDVDVCSNGCGYLSISYNSCRNRHCPKCQSLQQARWLETRLERLLPTRSFHLVVTLPHELNPLARFETPPRYSTGLLTNIGPIIDLPRPMSTSMVSLCCTITIQCSGTRFLISME
jgi:hypothetical protein